MALTRANVEGVIVGRLKNLMFAAGQDVTVVGTNSVLNDSLARAVRMVGGTTADYSTVTTAEMLLVGEALYDDMFDLAEFYQLKSVQGNLAAGHILAGIVGMRIDQMEKDLASYLSPVTAGYITHDFAEHNE